MKMNEWTGPMDGMGMGMDNIGLGLPAAMAPVRAGISFHPSPPPSPPPVFLPLPFTYSFLPLSFRPVWPRGRGLTHSHVPPFSVATVPPIKSALAAQN